MLNLDREMVAVRESLPYGQHHLLPAARFPCDILVPLRDEGLLLRVLHFSGHGNLGTPGSLLFQGDNGAAKLLQPADFIHVLTTLPWAAKERLECIVLNGCSTTAPVR